MSIFPEETINLSDVIQQTVEETTNELPLLKEYAWDFETNDFILENGKFKIVEGLEALEIWIYKTLKTPRYRFLAYSWDYGHELEDLIGQGLSSTALKSEVERYLNECILINPYISTISNLEVTFINGVIKTDFFCNTLYGEVSISV